MSDYPNGENDSLSLRLDDLEPISIPFIFKSKNYVLREASEDAAVKYRNAVQRSLRTNQEGNVVGIDGMADAEPLLVSLCVFEVNPAGSKAPEGPVSLSWVRSLPSRFAKRLFAKARDISELSEDTEETLEKQINLLQRRLARLREGKATTTEGNAKNALDDTGGISTTPTS